MNHNARSLLQTRVLGSSGSPVLILAYARLLSDNIYVSLAIKRNALSLQQLADSLAPAFVNWVARYIKIETKVKENHVGFDPKSSSVLMHNITAKALPKQFSGQSLNFREAASYQKLKKIIWLYLLNEKNGIHSIKRDEVPEIRAFLLIIA